MSSYYIYIYSPSDFVQPIPAENSSGNFSGKLPFTLTLKPGAVPVMVKVTDNDAMFNEVDTTQNIASAITVNGHSWAAGTSINSAYDLYNAGSSLRVVTVHFGGDGYYAGPIHGIVLTEPMVPGQAYTFTQTITSQSVPHPYSQLYCFAGGTRIATPDGEIAVEDLSVGQLIQTLDHGLQPLCEVLTTTVPAVGRMAPVVIRAGVCGNQRDLVLSPQHRMLFTGQRAELLFGESEVLVAACHMAEAGLASRRPGGEVTYYHLVFDRHEIVFSEGAPSESFLPGHDGSIPHEARDEFGALFPQQIETARLCLRAHEAALLLAA